MMKTSTLRLLNTASFSLKNINKKLPTAFAARLVMMVVLCLGVGKSWGQVNISGGATVTQNFSIGTSATATLPTGWKIDKNTTVRSVGTYAAAVTATEQVAGNSMSSSAANGIYNFGAGVAASATDRAVGGISSGTASKSVNVYVDLLNNGAGSISSFTISYNVEKYRDGMNAAGSSIQMYYSTNGTSWTSAGASFLTSFAGGDATNNGFASAPGVTTPVTSQTLTTTIPASSHLYLAWNYSVTTGTTTTNVQALGIDDVSITAVAASSTATLANITQPTGSITQGNNNVVLSGFTITPAVSIDFTGVTVTGSGTATSTDIGNVRIFRDFNGDGIINTTGGTDAAVSASALAYSASMGFTISGETGFTAVRNYLIVADVAGVGISTTGNTVTASVASGAFTTTATTNTGSATGNSRNIVAPPGTTTISAGGGTEPATISSLINTQGAASLNFDITILDDGATPATDGAATQISQMIFNQGTGNTVSNWTLAIAGAELSDGTNTMTGTINSTNITFSSITNTVGTLGYIGDDASKTYTLKVWLNSDMTTLKTTIDNLKLVFRVQTADITVSGVGSQLAAAQDQNSGSANNAITVSSTALAYVQDATNVFVNAPMAPSVKVAAVDANGNRDLDFVSQVRITSTGTLTGTPVDATAIAGLATFATLTHTATGTGLTLNAERTTTLDWDITSATFNVTTPTNYYSQASGDPATLSNWNTVRGGGGSVPAAFTDGNFIIQATHNMTTTTTWSVGATTTILEIENGGTLTANNAVTVASGSTFMIDGGGTYIHNNTTAASSTIFAGTENFAATSNVTLQNWSSSSSSIPAITFGNLTITYSPTAAWNQSGSLTHIQGNFTINNGSANAMRLSGNANLTLTIDGDLIVTSGILQFNNASSGNTYILNIGGSYNQTGGTFDPNTGTANLAINFTGSGKSFTQSSGTLTSTRINWTVNTGASLTLNNSLPVNTARTFAIDGTVTCSTNVAIDGTLALGSTGTLVIGSNTLTLNGAVTGTGTLSGSATSNLIVGGTAGTLNFTTGSRTLKDLTLNASAGATLGTPLDITAGASPGNSGTVIVNGGAVLASAGNLTIKSNEFGTARVGNSAGSITGNVRVERFIKLRSPGTGAGADNYGRAYRLLAPSVTTSGGSTIRTNWMENGLNATVGTNDNPQPGYGTQITGAGGNANGFDVTLSNAPSLYNTANGITPTYTAIGSTGGNLNALTGYFMYLRGDRSMDMTLPLTTNMPTSSTTLRATGLLTQGPVSSFTNAYDGTALSLNLVTNPYASAIDFAQVFAASSNIAPFYTFWDPNSGTRGGFVTVTILGVPTEGAANQYIQAGQAFFVQADGVGTPVVNITESQKVANNNNGVFLAPPPPSESFKVSLYFTESNGYRRIADGATALYNEQYSKQVDAFDAAEINNWDENIAIARDGKHLAIESRPVIGKSDDLPIFMNNMKQQVYEFEFTPTAFTNTKLKAELIDNFLNTKTPLSVTASTVVSFTITADPASKATDRFKVVFGAEAKPQVDASPIKTQTGITVYPNPMTGNSFKVDLNNLAKGNYLLSLYDNTGMLIHSEQFVHDGSQATRTVLLKTAVTPGVYQLQLSNEKGFKTSQKIFKN